MKVMLRVCRNLVSLLRSAVHLTQLHRALYPLQEPEGGECEGIGVRDTVLEKAKGQFGDWREGSHSACEYQ